MFAFFLSNLEFFIDGHSNNLLFTPSFAPYLTPKFEFLIACKEGECLWKNS